MSRYGRVVSMPDSYAQTAVDGNNEYGVGIYISANTLMRQTASHPLQQLTLRGIFDSSSQLKMLPSLVQLKLLGEADRLSRRFYGSGWASRRYACNSSTTASTCGSASILK
jgi:hypothetical protein